MNLIIAILVQLKAAAGLLIPEPSLRMQLRVTQSPAPTGTEISDALLEIERNKWAINLRDPITRDVKWKITDAGKAELAERGL